MNEFKIVTVRVDDLREYLIDYHHRTERDTCKADASPWPCDVYRRLWEAVNGPNDV